MATPPTDVIAQTPFPAHDFAPPVRAAQRSGRLGTQTVMYTLPWLCNAIVLLACVALGYMTPTAWMVFLALMPALALAQWLMRRVSRTFGLSQGAIFFLAMLLSLVPGDYAVLNLDRMVGRAAMVIMVLAPMAYGVLTANTRWLLAVSALLLANHIFLVWALQTYRPEQYSHPGEWLTVLAVGIICAGLSYLVGHLSRLRSRLQERSQALRDAMARLSELASRDELTGLLNRRSLLERLEQAFALEQPCSLALLDVDHFKRVNDTWGHHVGDEVLRRVAQAAQAWMAESGGEMAFGRFGGEEFLLVLPGHGARAALAPVSRLQAVLSRIDFTDVAPTLKVTVSAGLASRAPAEAPEALLAAADAALYEAKAQGRNRVCRREETGA